MSAAGYPHDSPGCQGAFCQSKVCQHDPWCCQGSWDDYCVEWVQELCSICD